MEIGDVTKAQILRDVALDCLIKANQLDGAMGCTCTHRRDQHQTGVGAWTGFCDDTECKCEEFEAW